MPNELLLFTYHFPQISQQNQKTTSTKSRQDTFLKYRLGSIPRSPFGQKTSIKFSKFSVRPKQNPVAIGDRASVISIPALQSNWSEDFDPPRIGPLVQICGGVQIRCDTRMWDGDWGRENTITAKYNIFIVSCSIIVTKFTEKVHSIFET